MAQSARAERSSDRTLPWDPERWLLTRDSLIAMGKACELPALMRHIYESTEKALHWRKYPMQGRADVDLSRHLAPAETVRWLNRSNAKVPPASSGEAQGLVQPPIIIVPGNAINLLEEINERAGSLMKDHELWMALEVSDFTTPGSLDLNINFRGSETKQNLMVRTDFKRYAELAESHLRYDEQTLQERMTTPQDPYVFTCADLTLFRGAREDGFPFLENPLHFTGIMYAMTCKQPGITQVYKERDKGVKEVTVPVSWYSDEVEQNALLQRLSLIGYAALQDRTYNGKKPILILNAAGCTDGGMHPRDAVANSLKHWRKRFTGLFHSVILCCGDNQELAEFFDVAVNKQVYAGMVQGSIGSFAEWHWMEELTSMHVNTQDFLSIGKMYHAMRSHTALGGIRPSEGQEEPDTMVRRQSSVGDAAARQIDRDIEAAMTDSRNRKEHKDATELAVEGIFEEAKMREQIGRRNSVKFQEMLDGAGRGTLSQLKADMYFAKVIKQAENDDSLPSSFGQLSGGFAGFSARMSRDRGVPSDPTSPGTVGGATPGRVANSFGMNARSLTESEASAPASPTATAGRRRSSAAFASLEAPRRMSYTLSPAPSRKVSLRMAPEGAEEQEIADVGKQVSALLARNKDRKTLVDADMPVWQRRRKSSTGKSADDPPTEISLDEQIRLRHQARDKLMRKSTAISSANDAANANKMFQDLGTIDEATLRARHQDQKATAKDGFSMSRQITPGQATTTAGGDCMSEVSTHSATGLDWDDAEGARLPPLTPRSATPKDGPKTEQALRAELSNLARAFMERSEGYWASATKARSASRHGSGVKQRDDHQDDMNAILDGIYIVRQDAAREAAAANVKMSKVQVQQAAKHNFKNGAKIRAQSSR